MYDYGAFPAVIMRKYLWYLIQSYAVSLEIVFEGMLSYFYKSL